MSTPEAPDARLAGAPFLLHVGTGHAHKNVPVLLRTFAAVRSARPGAPMRLALAGYYPGLDAALQNNCREFAGDVVHLGRVTPPQLSGLYRSASALLFPSLYEGFGLPPLEAMAHSCPVVCSNAAALPEVVGDAGLLCAPDDVEALRAAVLRVLEEPGLAETLRVRGLAQAARFRWSETAREMLVLYANAMLGPVKQ